VATAVAQAAGPAAEPVAMKPVKGAGLAEAVARCVRSGGRFLHLCDLPDGGLLALCDTAGGARAWRTPPLDPGAAVPRPSARGVPAALHAERALAAEGIRWSTDAPEVAVHGRGVFTFPLGPVRADVAESVAWRLLVMGDEVLGLRLDFGYKRRGVEAAMGEAGPAAGVALAERVTGTSPVAHALAYSHAWEAALGVEVPPAALFWRGVLAELERLHSHLGDLGSLASSTGLPVASAELLLLKEQVLQLCADLCGHRYLRGAVVPGGLAVRPPGGAAPDVAGRLQPLARRFGEIVQALDGSGSFLDRLHAAGRIPERCAAELQPVGPVGRACGLPYDVRLDRPYGAYREQAPRRVVERRSDAWARYRVRVGEVEASLEWLAQRFSGSVPAAGLRQAADLGAAARPGGDEAVFLARVEAPRGELLYLILPPAGGRAAPWVRLRPPSAANWALVPYAVAEGNVLQDVPIIDASFGLSVSAMAR
jgi:formate hydrogenlyase subunit 5